MLSKKAEKTTLNAISETVEILLTWFRVITWKIKLKKNSKGNKTKLQMFPSVISDQSEETIISTKLKRDWRMSKRMGSVKSKIKLITK